MSVSTMANAVHIAKNCQESPKVHELENGPEILHQHAKSFQTSYHTQLKMACHQAAYLVVTTKSDKF